MPRQSKYRFPDEAAARRFVQTCLKQGGFAFFRDGLEVTVIDPTGMFGRDIFNVARECGGTAV